MRGSGAEFCPQGDIRGKEFLSRVCGQKWVPPKACQRHANRSVSYCGGRRLHRICVPAPVLQRRCPARPHLCGVVARYPDSDGSCNFQGAGMKNCRPVARLQILSEYKKTAPQGTKGFCRGQAAAKWFGVAAERRFITVKWFIWVRGYHEMDGVSRERLEF